MPNEYIPPRPGQNEDYILPPIKVMLKHFRKSGADIDVFLNRYIEIREEREDVRYRFYDLLDKDEEAKAEYRNLLRLKLRALEDELAESNIRKQRKKGCDIQDQISDINSELVPPKTSLDVIDGL